MDAVNFWVHGLADLVHGLAEWTNSVWQDLDGDPCAQSMFWAGKVVERDVGGLGNRNERSSRGLD